MSEKSWRWELDNELKSTTWYDLHVKDVIICAISNECDDKTFDNEWEVIYWHPANVSKSCPPQIYADTLEEAQSKIEELLILWVMEGWVEI